MTLWLISAFLIFLCWGSFLNALAYRIIRGYSLTSRSFCPHCKTTLAWYDLIPVASWFFLWGRCRTCTSSISLLYPFIELLTAILLTLMLQFINPIYWLSYWIFFSALIVTIRTDFEKMLISRYMTWGLVPAGILLAALGMLPITLYQSVTGAFFGYVLLWLIAYFFYRVRKIEGVGEGDLDLLTMIGSFTGPLGAWISLFLGAFFGSIIGLYILSNNRTAHTKIPFGPWLAAGAFCYVFLQQWLLTTLLGL